MSIRITVKSAELTERTTKTGKKMFTQKAWAHLLGRDGKVEEYPTRIELTIWGNAQGNPETPPNPPGDYTLAPGSFYVGDYGRLEVSPRLVPVAQATRAA